MNVETTIEVLMNYGGDLEIQASIESNFVGLTEPGIMNNINYEGICTLENTNAKPDA